MHDDSATHPHHSNATKDQLHRLFRDAVLLANSLGLLGYLLLPTAASGNV